MNLFSRIAVVLICLALATGAIAIVVLAWTIPQESIDWLRDAVNWLEEHNRDTEKVLLTTAGALIALLALVIVLLELLPRSATDVKVVDLKVGDAVLSTAAIAQRVEESVRKVPHVATAKAFVKAKRKGVIVSLDLHVDPHANLASVTDEACQATTDVLTNLVHVKLLEPPHARLHYYELRLKRPATPAPQTLVAAPQAKPAEPDSKPATAVTAPEPAATAPAVPPPAPGRQVIDPAIGTAELSAPTSAPAESPEPADPTANPSTSSRPQNGHEEPPPG